MKTRKRGRALRRRYGRALGARFEKMASKIVGDGKKPNRFFVTLGGKVVALLESEGAAVAAAKALGEAQSVRVEDRLVGTVWENEHELRLSAAED